MLNLDIPGISFFIVALYVVEFLLAFTIIFLERKNPSATVAWIMIIFVIPVGGIVLYLLFSQNISRQKLFRLNQSEESMINENLQEQIMEMDLGVYKFNKHEARKWHHMIKLHQTYGSSFFTQDNTITILTDGRHKMHSLLEDIKNAQQTINIMYFIVKDDTVGRTLIEALTEKAREGIEVRFLLDAMGSRQIGPKQLNEFKEAGGKYAFFFSPKFKYLNMKLNYRNHRKLVIIDNNLGYLGGFNIGNEYLGRASKFGYWRDTHLRLTGSCIVDIQIRFILDWRLAAKEELDIPVASFEAAETDGSTGIQIVSSGPDSTKEEIKHGYLKMISAAKKNIFIQTPYFVPDQSILESLKNAALSGIDLRIMIPCKPDHMFVYWATYSYIGILLDAGAKVYIYDNGFMHAKTICVDGEVASVGTANFDIRSFKLNFEANAFIYDAFEVQKLEEAYNVDMASSHELTTKMYKERNIMIKFKESIARLLSDLL
jgi:cardiolipin synthase